jgi:hypothetical protein
MAYNHILQNEVYDDENDIIIIFSIIIIFIITIIIIIITVADPESLKGPQGSTLTLVRLSGTNEKNIRTSEQVFFVLFFYI